MERREMPDRSHYPVRKLRMSDPEANDDDLSETTTPEERLGMMSVLSRRCWLLMGEPVDGTRLQRHVVHIGRRDS